MGGPQGVWTGAENLAPARIRPPNRPTGSELLYGLRYAGPQFNDSNLNDFRSLYNINMKQNNDA